MADDVNLPEGATSGRLQLGTVVMIPRAKIKNPHPDLPEWIPAQITAPPDESGWFRWYDGFVWIETEMELFAETPPWSIVNQAWIGQNIPITVSEWRELQENPSAPPG